MDRRFGGRSSMGWSCAGEGEDDARGGGGGGWAVAIRWKEMGLAEEGGERRRGGGLDGRRGKGSLAAKRRRERAAVAVEAIGGCRER